MAIYKIVNLKILNFNIASMKKKFLPYLQQELQLKNYP
jgi:hypothetical protein